MYPLSLLFKRFLKLGATAYGGPAIAQHMKKADRERIMGWLKEPEFMQGMALCQTDSREPRSYSFRPISGIALEGLEAHSPARWLSFIPAFTSPADSFRDLLPLGRSLDHQSLFKGLAPIVVAIVLNAFINFGKPMALKIGKRS